MANEIVLSDLVTNGGALSEYLAAETHQVLYDPTGLRALCAYKPYDPMGASATMSTTKLPAPGAAAAASSEISGGFSNSAYTTSEFQLTVARYGRLIQNTDLMNLVSGARVNVDTLLANLTEAFELTYTDLIAALFPNLANVVGTAGDQMDSDTIFDGMFQLNLSNVMPGTTAAVLHNRQINQLKTSLRGETGAMQWQDPTAQMLSQNGPGFVGRWAGVDFWQSDSVTTVSSNHIGAMFDRNCFAWTVGPVGNVVRHINAGDIVLATPEWFVERIRNAPDGMNSYLLNFYPAAAEAEDLRGVRLRSIAS